MRLFLFLCFLAFLLFFLHLFGNNVEKRCMTRRLTLKISKQIKEGKPLFLIYCPARLSPDGKARRYSFRRRGDADLYRSKLYAAWQNLPPTPLTPTESADAQAAMRALAEAGISTTLLAAIQTALPFLTRTRKITVSQLIEEFSELKNPQWRPLTARNFRDAAKKFCATFAERDPTTLISQEITVWLNATYPSPASIELLGKEAFIEAYEPLFERSAIVRFCKRSLRKIEGFCRAIASAQEVIEIEIMQLVGADHILRLLHDFSRFIGRKQLGGNFR